MLEVAHLCSGYGSVPVLHDVNFVARAGEITLVIGENGAGKSTLLRTIAGFLTPTSGSVMFDGAELAGRKPDAVAALGARLVLDGHRVFPRLSVWDNIRLGAMVRRDIASFEYSVTEVFSLFPILRERLRQPAGSLSGGQQQMLALAQALVAAPKLLLCDEPSLGLAQALMPPILKSLRATAERGAAVVVVEQYFDLVLPFATHVIVLDRGRVAMSRAAADFLAASSRRSEYL